MFRFLIYLAMASVYVYTLVYDITTLPIVRGGSWFFKLRYLTFLNFAVSTFYYVLCTVRAVVDMLAERQHQATVVKDAGGRVRRQRSTSTSSVPSYYAPTPLHNVCDFMYSTLVFPAGMAVVALFWGIYAIDRELIYPKSLDKIFPQWINQVWHTAPIPFILVDTLLVCHRYPSKLKGCLTIGCLGVLYCLNLVYTKYSHGFWLYPIFDAFDQSQMMMFFAFTVWCIVVLFMVGYGLNSLVWGEASHPHLELDEKLGNSVGSRRIKSRID